MEVDFMILRKFLKVEELIGKREEELNKKGKEKI